MKCPYCNTVISNDSLFCGACGKKLPQQKECVKCGKLIDANSEFCPYCGAKQDLRDVETPISTQKPLITPLEVKRNKKTSRIVSIIVGCVLTLAVLGVGYYWLVNNDDYSLEGLEKITTGEYELYDFHDGYTAIKKDNKIGVINKKGEIIASPVFHPCGNFDLDNNFCYAFMSEERMRLGKSISDKIKYGFIDKDGKEIIPFIYDEASNFINGLALVSKNGKKGYINKDGKEVIPFIYKFAVPFYSNIALVSKDANKCYYIDKSGKTIASFAFAHDDIIAITKEGLIVWKDDKKGFVNNEGKLILPCIYDNISLGYCDDLLCVQKDNDFGYYNTTGKEIVPCKYGMGLASYNGIAKVFDEWAGDDGAYIDSAGNILFSFVQVDKRDTYGNFCEDLAVVSHDGLFGYVDKTGKEVIPLSYESAHWFSEGMAVVKKDGLYGYIDKNGNEVIPFIYEEANDFSDGLALVKKDGVCGYIDKKGKSTLDYKK